MKLWDLLKHDHREVEQLFARLKEAGDSKTQEELFRRIKHELELHTREEEKYFYPVVERNDATKDLAEHSIAEHGEVKKLLSEMSGRPAGDKKWKELCEQLESGVKDHVEEEETQLFPIAEETLDHKTIEAIGEAIAHDKEAAKAG